MPEQPRVFVSSTISDFKDLRLALKYWLEEAGFQVFLSECNDFPVDPASSTFQNCLEVLKSCHYVVLLVGYHKGSYYDESKRVSVTRAEYRKAYELVKVGKLKLVSCVRWEVQEDLSSGNSLRFQDLSFTQEFLAEIKRDEEIREGAKGGGPFPKGNWVFRFRDFRELMQALSSSLRVGSRLRRKAIEANLAWELRLNLRALLRKTSEGVLIPSPHRYGELQQQLSLRADQLMKSVKISRKQSGRLAFLAVDLASFDPQRIAMSGLNEAINSGEFLGYDPTVDEFTVGPTQASLLDLRTEISELKNSYSTAEVRRITVDVLEHLRASASAIAVKQVCILFDLANSIHNVRMRTASIAAYLAGERSEPGVEGLAPPTPFADEVGALQAERPTDEEIHSWLQHLSG
jgi:hypothetical protein